MSNNTINWKGECRYGEECYRVNPSHLKEYQHPHREFNTTLSIINY